MIENVKVSSTCSKVIYIALILAPFFASFSSAATNVCIALSIVAFLIKKAISRDFSTIRKTPILIPFLLMILVSIVSFRNTVSLTASLQGIVKLLRYLALVFVVEEELQGSDHARKIVFAILLGLLLASLDGLFQLFVGYDLIRHRPVTVKIDLPRVTAAFLHPNMFGIYLALFLPLSICVSLYAYQGVKRRFGFLTSILALFCLLSTFSRAAFAGLMGALLLIGGVKKDKVLGTALILIMGILPFALPQNIKDWKKTTTSTWEFLLETRKIGDFRNALNMIRHNPWTGVGVNTYVLNLEKYKVRDASRFVSDTGYSHNTYLQMAAEIGLFGPLLFFWLLFRLFRSGCHSYRKLEDSFLKMTTLGILGGIVAFLISGLLETVLYYSKMANLFWFYVGLLLAMSKFIQRPQEI